MGGSALAIPYTRYYGQWDTPHSAQYPWWTSFVDYIIALEESYLSRDTLTYIRDYGYFGCNIPMGYGLGSSGSFAAAVYELACVEPSTDYIMVQSRLGLIESFFHGRSSGYDPLISLLNQGVCKSDNTIQVWRPQWPQGLHCYLVDSGTTRSGKGMIAKFGQLEQRYPARCREIRHLNDRIIREVTRDACRIDDVFGMIKQLSALQLRYMDDMIVPELRQLWEQSLQDVNIALKICGAGGGGNYLLFATEVVDGFAGLRMEEVLWDTTN